MLPDPDSVQTISLPNFLFSATEPDDPKKTSDTGDQKELSPEEMVSGEEDPKKAGKSRKRSKDEGECIFGRGCLGGLNGLIH